MGNGRKKWLIWLACGFLAICSLFGQLPVAAAETTSEQMTTTEAETSSEELSKGQKVAGFLVLFTIACGGSAYLVMRPSLKKLKDAKQQTTESQESKK